MISKQIGRLLDGLFLIFMLQECHQTGGAGRMSAESALMLFGANSGPVSLFGEAAAASVPGGPPLQPLPQAQPTTVPKPSVAGPRGLIQVI